MYTRSDIKAARLNAKIMCDRQPSLGLGSGKTPFANLDRFLNQAEQHLDDLERPITEADREEAWRKIIPGLPEQVRKMFETGERLKREAIEAGDVVRLNSGGPERTVFEIHDNDTRAMLIDNQTGRVLSPAYRLECLTLVRKSGEDAPEEIQISTEILKFVANEYTIRAVVTIGNRSASSHVRSTSLSGGEQAAVYAAKCSLHAPTDPKQ